MKDLLGTHFPTTGRLSLPRSAQFFRLSRSLKSVCHHYPKKQHDASTRWFTPTATLLNLPCVLRLR